MFLPTDDLNVLFTVQIITLFITMQVTQDQADNIQIATIGQATCTLWFDERKNRVTASKVKRISDLMPTTSRKATVKEVLYSKDISTKAAIAYGIAHEDEARNDLQTTHDVDVELCGLFVNVEHPWLAASPDGITTWEGEKALVEIKCPFR